MHLRFQSLVLYNKVQCLYQPLAVGPPVMVGDKKENLEITKLSDGLDERPTVMVGDNNKN